MALISDVKPIRNEKVAGDERRRRRMRKMKRRGRTRRRRIKKKKRRGRKNIMIMTMVGMVIGMKERE